MGCMGSFESCIQRWRVPILLSCNRTTTSDEIDFDVLLGYFASVIPKKCNHRSLVFPE